MNRLSKGTATSSLVRIESQKESLRFEKESDQSKRLNMESMNKLITIM